ncbi:MAG: NAD(P)/FAD-dependent oxidoreductase, partial [Leucothrix sp.]
MSLPLPDSLWAKTATPCPQQPPLQGDITADVAIIGAGFTGLRAALELSQQGVDVVVVDAGQIGWGASGRNGGQVNPIGHESPIAIEKKWSKRYGKTQGKALAERFSQLYLNAADELFDLVNKHNIACDAEQNGWIRSVHGPAAEASFHEMFKGWHDAGADIDMLTASEVENMSGCKGYGIGWIAKRAGTVQPLSYVRGLANAALKVGAAVHSDTYIKTLEQHNGKWKLQAARGSITADQVL